jgi:hypothetical protein
MACRSWPVVIALRLRFWAAARANGDRIRIFNETHSFEAPATVVYSHAFMGMGMKFREVQPKYEEVLRLWLPEAAEQTNQAHG